VSSTFDDFADERDRLQEQVWPALRAFCAKHGARFQAIDLRWGVNKEAAAGQQTMAACLSEIAHCREVTTRPNFLVLLGNRYGWLPLPERIPEDEYLKIIDRIGGAERAILEAWYLRDDNASPSEYRLQPRRNEFLDQRRWRAVEEQMHVVLRRATSRMHLDERRRIVFEASATEQEVTAAAFDDSSSAGVVCVLRAIEGSPDVAAEERDHPVRLYVDAEPYSVEALRSLKVRLLERLEGAGGFAGEGCRSAQVLRETVRWVGDGPQFDEAYLDRFADGVYRCLEQAVAEELQQPREGIPTARSGRTTATENLDDEGLTHLFFAQHRVRFFRGRKNELARIAQYLVGADPKPLVVHGEGGSGKSALMSEAVLRAFAEHPTATVVHRFVGATPGSSDATTLLRSLCLELARHASEDVAEVPSDYARLVVDFSDRLSRATPSRPIIAFIDAVDQLPGYSGSGALPWVSLRLPACARLVLSTRPGATLEPLRVRAELLELSGMPDGDGEHLLDAWLRDAGRRLQAPQRAEVIEKFRQSRGNPLYLRLAFEQARHWDSGTGAPPENLATGVQHLILTNLFKRLEHPHRHGGILVSRALGYLAASRYGLAEDEVLDVLSRDVDVYRWFLLGARQAPPDLQREAARFPGRPPVIAPATWLTCIREAARLLDEQPWRLFGLLDRQVARRAVDLAVAAAMDPERADHVLIGLSRDGLARCELGRWTATASTTPADEAAPCESQDSDSDGILAWAREYRQIYAASWPFPTCRPSVADEDEAVLAWYGQLHGWRDQLDVLLKNVLPRSGGPRLPYVLWSRLAFDLEPYLTERRHEGAELIAFFHRELRDAAEAAYARGAVGRTIHSRLADYFRARADPDENGSWGSDGRPTDPRGLSELPYHLTRAQRWAELSDTLTDFRFAEQKAVHVGVHLGRDADQAPEVHTGVLRLQDDLDSALRHLPGAGDDRAGGIAPIITPTDLGEGLVVRCPYCRKGHPYRDEWRGEQVNCPNGDCSRLLEITPFVVRPSRVEALFAHRRHGAAFHSVATAAAGPGTYPGADPQRAAAMNRKYYEDLAGWKALPWRKRRHVPRPERPTGI
jgi:hypothetical protein